MKIIKQNSSDLIMIEPKHFGFNIETAEDNHYQINDDLISEIEIKQKANKEFNELVKKIKEENISVRVFEDEKNIITTDSVFPNNWISLHEEGKVILYPMFSKNRRKERENSFVKSYLNKNYFINQIIDLTDWEKKEKFLEGTGSMIFDRINKICFAAISNRTSSVVLKELCDILHYDLFTFKANQTYNNNRVPIYHTNVMMSLGEKFVVICLESIDDITEKSKIISLLKKLKKEIIEINEKQVENFAGNLLQVENKKREKFIVMSSKAYNCFSKNQIEKLSKHGKIIHSNLDVIEKIGGGSARCMIAENFLQKK
tara:strand:- start:236 stop:1180 length:945 start_codon:yes stop_codon:yes gene_type:complete